MAPGLGPAHDPAICDVDCDLTSGVSVRVRRNATKCPRGVPERSPSLEPLRNWASGDVAGLLWHRRYQPVFAGPVTSGARGHKFESCRAYHFFIRIQQGPARKLALCVVVSKRGDCLVPQIVEAEALRFLD